MSGFKTSSGEAGIVHFAPAAQELGDAVPIGQYVPDWHSFGAKDPAGQ